jgi:hypothetical protein
MICRWLRKLRKRRMRPISDITDKVPIGYFYDGQSKKVDVLPTVAFFNLFQGNYIIPSKASLELATRSALDYNSAASNATNFQRLHTKIGHLAGFIEQLMLSHQAAGTFPDWDQT